jgi:hypothetical protein
LDRLSRPVRDEVLGSFGRPTALKTSAAVALAAMIALLPDDHPRVGAWLKRLRALRGKWDGVKEVIHSTIMNGFDDGEVVLGADGPPTYDLIDGPYKSDELDEWPLTPEEVGTLTGMAGAIMEFPEMGGQRYETYADDAALRTAWAALEAEEAELNAEPEGYVECACCGLDTIGRAGEALCGYCEEAGCTADEPGDPAQCGRDDAGDGAEDEPGA